jgi:hypothetical protein
MAMKERARWSRFGRPSPAAIRELRHALAMGAFALAAVTLMPAVAAPFVVDSWQPATVLGVVTGSLFFIAVMLLGRTPVVLYLRRFGDAETRGRFEEALEADLANYFRIVAISDPATNPVSQEGPQFLGCALAWTAVAVPTFLVQLLLPVPAFTRILVTLLVVTSLSGKIQERIVRKLAQSASIRIDTAAAADAAERNARRWRERRPSSYLPRRHFETVSVASPLWQDVVIRLAMHADAILIDVSNPGPGVRWELETLQRRWPHRLVVIADRKPMLDDGGDTTATAVLEIDAACPVLTPRRGKMNSAFARDVRRALSNAIAKAGTAPAIHVA